MASSLDTRPILARPDSRPIVVTVIAVGFLLLCSLGGLNALIVLINGSTRISLVEEPRTQPVDFYDYDGALSVEEPRPELLALDRQFGVGYVAISILGIAGAIALLRRKAWSRLALWATAGSAVAAHGAYTLLRLRIETGEIVQVLDRQDAFELMAMTSLIQVAIQSIPIAILAGLLRHSAVRSYLSTAPDV